MANQKLTDKTPLSSLSDGDLFHVVDVSDNNSSPQGTSKKGLFSLIKSTLKTYFDSLYLSDLLEDTTPQLGGNLETNKFSVIIDRDASGVAKPFKTIPSDFDWENINVSFANSIWEIIYEFDLSAITTTLPIGVTLRFNGGVIKDATINFDNTFVEYANYGVFQQITKGTGVCSFEKLTPIMLGAEGVGASGYLNDDFAFNLAIDILTSTSGGVLYVEKPISFYQVDPIIFTLDFLEIIHETQTTKIVLNPQDLDVVTNSGIYQPQGILGNTVKGLIITGGILDGNKGNHINEISAAGLNHEILDLKFCEGATVRNVNLINAHSEGVDIDQSSNTIIDGCIIDNCGGYGIHCSLDSIYCFIVNNKVTNCGHDKLRGGIDAFQSIANPSLFGYYQNNNVSDCYRNYVIPFNNNTDKLKTHYFDSSNLSQGTTVLEDLLTGCSPAITFSNTPEYRLHRGFASTSANMRLLDADILEFRKYKESTALDELILSIKMSGQGLIIPSASGGIDVEPSSGTKWSLKRNGGDSEWELKKDDVRFFTNTKEGDYEFTQTGKGIVVVSPDGLTTKRIGIDNAGAISITNQ